MEYKIFKKGYRVYDYGRFDAALVHNGEMIAITDDDVVIGLDPNYKNVIQEWADDYCYPLVWRC